MLRTRAWALALAIVAGAAHAQLSDADPDWKEVEAPPPAPLRLDRLLPIDIPESTLRFGVDPASVALTPDGIVRYVVVATSNTGAVNAFYEGIRCSTGEVRLYARHSPDKGWVPVKDSLWRSLSEARPSRHSLVIARTGACNGNAANQSAAQIVRDLGGSVNWRFWNR
ncbi:CNP1-like family protein [Caenimonas terrae]|uniref:CNP1-like family protein n=1 Tax=Caenimonas terrae TaxID=696074 RepID=A0ABW0NHY0_9BURK